MSAPAERDDEPTGRFVPLWDDEEDEVVDLPERVIVVREPAPAAAAEPEPESELDPEPALELEPAPVAARERADPGALRSVAPEPVTMRPARPSAARWAVAKVRAASGLLVLVFVTGVLLAAAIGLTVAALAFALRSAVGSG